MSICAPVNMLILRIFGYILVFPRTHATMCVGLDRHFWASTDCNFRTLLLCYQFGCVKGLSLTNAQLMCPKLKTCQEMLIVARLFEKEKHREFVNARWYKRLFGACQVFWCCCCDMRVPKVKRASSALQTIRKQRIAQKSASLFSVAFVGLIQVSRV